MYRFFRSQCMYPPNIYVVLIHTNVRHSKKMCSHCKFHHESVSKCINFVQIRNYMIRKNLAKFTPPVEKKGIPKELCNDIQLSKATSGNVKHDMIKRSKDSRLSRFAAQTNSDSNTSAVRDDMHIEMNAENIELEENHGTVHQSVEVDSLALDDSFQASVTQYCSTESLNEFNKKYTKEGKKIVRERRNIHNLLIHLHVYIKCGMLDRAYAAFLRHRKDHNVKAKKFNENTDLYNLLMEAYTHELQIDKVINLYRLLKKDMSIISPNAKTFAVMLEAIMNANEKKRNELLREITTDMKQANVTFDDIFNQAKFKLNQRENTLKSIRLIDPQYEPSYTPPDMTTDCKFLKKIQESFMYSSPAKGLLTSKDLQVLLGKQIRAECQDEIVIKSIIQRKDVDIDERKNRIAALEEYWEKIISEAFDKNLYHLKSKENSKPPSAIVLYPFFEVMDKSVFVKAVLREIQYLGRNSEKYSVPLNTLFFQLGKSIYRKYMIQTNLQDGVVDKAISVYLKYADWYLHPETCTNYKNKNSRAVWQQIEYEMRSEGASLRSSLLEWHRSLCIEIGAFLYNIIIHDIKVEINYTEYSEKRKIPAFYTLYRNINSRLIEQIKPHPIISRLYRDTKSDMLPFQATFIPSLIPPCPWVSIDSGPYLVSKVGLIRQHSHSPLHYEDTLDNVPVKQLYPIFDSLNQLSSIPWKVNVPVLDIIIEIFQNGGSDELNVPRPPSALPNLPPLNANATAEEKLRYNKMSLQLKQKKADMYSVWCDILYRLSLANHLRNSIFWLPHNMDFRGRTYPVPPHLNHLGSDLARSILKFGLGKPLGPTGLDWLKIHVINLTGLKKRESIGERLRYANEILDDILDSAERPITGKMWWAKSDEPWQTLAACMEIAEALKAPNIEEFVSSFPVHQDGSCNGLQHYAALGRDQIGAESVNLSPSDVPRDVYSTVASMVEDQRKIDARDGVEIAQILEGHITRKVIKQTVMTTVYGVTRYGARLQITNQLSELKSFPQDKIWKASLYLVDKTFDTLRCMFTSAKEIQDWFTLCASIICTIYAESVEWITPLGFPIMQPYVSEKTYFKQSHAKETALRPAKLKQRNAFPPNFIHSLDSTHMMLTSLYCEHAGITFVSVHDCFWTHPSTVERMNKICREQFVALHSEPILENLSQYFCQKYADKGRWPPKTGNITPEYVRNCFTSIPERGQFNLHNVLSSVYFFS